MLTFGFSDNQSENRSLMDWYIHMLILIIKVIVIYGWKILSVLVILFHADHWSLINIQFWWSLNVQLIDNKVWLDNWCIYGGHAFQHSFVHGLASGGTQDHTLSMQWSIRSSVPIDIPDWLSNTTLHLLTLFRRLRLCVCLCLYPDFELLFEIF